MHVEQEGSRPKRRSDAREPMRANRAAKEKLPLGGPRKSLIRLDSDKEIQAFPLVGFGWAWLDLAQFGPIWIRLGFSLVPLHICATDLIRRRRQRASLSLPKGMIGRALRRCGFFAPSPLRHPRT